MRTLPPICAFWEPGYMAAAARQNEHSVAPPACVRAWTRWPAGRLAAHACHQRAIGSGLVRHSVATVWAARPVTFQIGCRSRGFTAAAAGWPHLVTRLWAGFGLTTWMQTVGTTLFAVE